MGKNWTQVMMTMMMIKRILIVFSFLFVCSISRAQYVDAGAWLSAGVSVDFLKDFSLDVSEEFRYNISVADLYQVNTNLGVDYKITKKIKVGIDYRYSVRAETDVNRFGAGISLREGVKDFDFAIRSKAQYSLVPDRDEGTSWRNKGTIKYEGLKDITPYISLELFYSFSNEVNQFDSYRSEGGLDLDIGKNGDMNVFYMYDKEFNVNNPETMHIFGLGYVYKF